jgi:hypothetical protein
MKFFSSPRSRQNMRELSYILYSRHWSLGFFRSESSAFIGSAMDMAAFWPSRQPPSLAAEYKTYTARSLPDSGTFGSDQLPEHISNHQALNGSSFPQFPPKARLAGGANDGYAPNVEVAEEGMMSITLRSHQNPAPSHFQALYTKCARILSPRLKHQHRRSKVEKVKGETKIKYVNSKFSQRASS